MYSLGHQDSDRGFIMEEDTELEEGEASLAYAGPPGSSFSDPDFSDIDKKLQKFLGEQQKQFLTAGSMDAEHLGSKYGGYGSFLPTQERKPPVLNSKSLRAPQSGDGRGRTSAAEGRMETAKPSTLVASGTLKGSYRGVTSGNGFGTGDGAPSTSGKVGGSNDKSDSQKNPPLTLRIKMASKDKEAVQERSVPVLCQNEVLGPVSSQFAGEEHGVALSPDAESSPDRSPMSMIQVMTSHRIPGGCLLSPLTHVLETECARMAALSDDPVMPRPSNKGECGSGFAAGPDEPGISKDKRLMANSGSAKRSSHLEVLGSSKTHPGDTFDAGESEMRQSLGAMERVCQPKKHHVGGADKIMVEESFMAKRVENTGLLVSGKAARRESVLKKEASDVRKLDLRPDKQNYSGDSYYDLQKPIGKEAGYAAKNTKGFSNSYKESCPDVKAAYGDGDAEGRLAPGEMEALGKGSGKEQQTSWDLLMAGAKGGHADNAVEEPKGVGIGSHKPMTSAEVRHENYKNTDGGCDEGYVDRDLTRDKTVRGFPKESRKSTGIDHKESLQMGLSKKLRKDAEEGRGTLAAAGQEGRIITKDAVAMVRKKSKGSAKNILFSKQAGKDSLPDLCTETSKLLTERGSDVKEKAMVADTSVRRVPLPMDANSEMPMGLEEVSRSQVRDLNSEAIKMDVSKGPKVKKKSKKEAHLHSNIEREVDNRVRQPVKKCTDLAVAELSNKTLPAFEGTIQAVTGNVEGGVPPPGNTVVVHDDWVLCETCEKWRLCAPWIKPEDLPKKWRCKMLTWLPNMNHCKYSEEETTAAVYNLLGVPPPIPVGQVDPGHTQSQLAPIVAATDVAASGEECKVVRPNKSIGTKKGVSQKVASVPGIPVVQTLKKGDGDSGKSKSINVVVQQPQVQLSMKTGTESNLAKRGGSGSQHLLTDGRKEKPKRGRGTEGMDSRVMKQQVKEVLNSFLAEDTDSSCKNGVEKNAHQVSVSEAATSARQVQSSAWREETNVESLFGKQHDVQDVDSRSLGERIDVPNYASDGSKRNLQSRRKMEIPEHSEEVPHSKKIKGSQFEDHWMANMRGMDERTLEYEGVQMSPPQPGSAEDEKQMRKDACPSRKNVLNAKKLKDTRSAKQSDRDADMSRVLQRAGNYGSPSMMTGVVGTDRVTSMDGRSDGLRSTSVVKDLRQPFPGLGDSGHCTEGRSAKEEESESEPRIGQKRKAPKEGDTQDTDSKKGRKTRGVLTNSQEAIQEGVFVKHVREFDDLDEAGESRQKVAGNMVNKLPDAALSQAQERRHHELGTADVEGQGVSTSSNLRFSKISSSSKSSASLSRGRGSPIESTVSSSPLRSPKPDDRPLGGGSAQRLESMDMMGNHYSANRLSPSPSPKRSLEREGDAQSDRSGPLGQSHRSWDDRPRSSDHDHEFRGSSRDAMRDASRYATSNGGDGFRRSRVARDEDRYWDEHREGRSNGGYFPERYERVPDDRYREREGSIDRYREVVRDVRYDRHKIRDDRFRERERDRERDRDRTRENWPSDRGEGREDRYTRDRNIREEWGKPSSRERRLEKLGGLNWMEGRSIREPSREERRPDGRQVLEDENCDGKLDSKPKSPGEIRDVLSQDLEGNAIQQSNYLKILKDAQRQEKLHSKSSIAWQGSSSFVDGMNWEADRRVSRKDIDAGSGRKAADALPCTDRHTMDVQESVVGLRTKVGPLCDTSITVDASKRSHEHVRASEDGVQVRKVPHGKAVAVNSGQGGKGFDGPTSSHAKEHSVAVSAANTAMRDGTDLKHSADRMQKHIGEEVESTDLYLQAALKFLQAAFLLEPVYADAAKLGEVTKSMIVYHSTAKLCEYCASSYERGGARNMPAAALAYKCAAVARMRVLMAKNTCFTRDHQELQSFIQTTSRVGQSASLGAMHATPAFPGRSGAENGSLPAGTAVEESPSSSSASDVDNLNNNQNVAGDKGTCTDKESVLDLSLPTSATSSAFSIPTHLQLGLSRILRDASDISASLNALKKAANATALADSACNGNSAKLEAMTAVKRVGEDSGFGDVEATVRLVRVALEAIGH